MPRAHVTVARIVRPGDEILHGGRFSRVATVRTAPGRKPKTGENLHIVTESNDVLKVNSTDPLRIRRSTT